MCQYCEETEVWEEPWQDEEDEGPYQCEWIDESEDDDEDEDDLDERRCTEHAGHAIAERYVHQHLCPEHREAVQRELEAGLQELLEESGLQEECEFLRIPTGTDLCEYVNPLEMLGPDGDEEECGIPATFAQRIVSTSLLCAAHAAEATTDTPD